MQHGFGSSEHGGVTMMRKLQLTIEIRATLFSDHVGFETLKRHDYEDYEYQWFILFEYFLLLMTLDFYDVSCSFHHSWRSLMMFAPAPNMGCHSLHNRRNPFRFLNPNDENPRRCFLTKCDCGYHIKSKLITMNHYEMIQLVYIWRAFPFWVHFHIPMFGY